MLGKLLKHEFKATGRLLLPIYIAFIIITPITAVYLRLNGTSLFPEDSMFFNVLSGLCMVLYIIANIAMVTASYIVILYMFYKTMVSKEAYLTHTLPVKTSSLLISKTLVAAIWSIIALVLMFVSILSFTRIIGVWHKGDITLEKIQIVLNQLGITPLFIILFILLIVVGLISSYTTYFTCFAVGQRFTGHPIAGAILSYMVLSFIMQIISTLAITAFSFTDFYDKLELDDSSIMYSNVPSLYLGFLIAFSSFLTIILFLISNHMFKNKLNI